MKLSKYNVCVQYKGNWLIYNLLKATCVVLDESEFFAFENSIDFKGIENCVRLGMYIEDDYSEIEEVLYYFRKNTDYYNQNCRKHRIYTTMACNARCPYCFELGSGSKSMSYEIADKVIERMLNKQGCAKNLVVTWFGGEPLLNVKIIDYISSKLKRELPQDVSYSSFMITNGNLFDEVLVKKAIYDWNLESLQVTIDGLKESYERIKGFRKENAFELLIRNIHMLLKSGVKVRIRLNYQEDNIEEICLLIDYISDEFKYSDNVFVYAHRIMSRDRKDNSKFNSADTDILIWDKIYQSGLNGDILGSLNPKLISCTAGSLYNEMYLPDGGIGKCAQAIADGDLIGEVNGGIKNNKIARWCSGVIDSKCLECNLLPACGGGCKYEIFSDKNGCFVSEKLLKHKLICYLKEIVDRGL